VKSGAGGERRVVYRTKGTSLELYTSGDTSVMLMRGRFDPKFGERALANLPSGNVALELHDVSPMDVSFVVFLRNLRRRVEAAGGRFWLLRPPGRLLDIIQMSSSDREFEAVQEVPDAGSTSADGRVRREGGPSAEMTHRIMSVRRDALRSAELERSMVAARERVRSLFPKVPPTFERFDTAFVYMPCEVIGGDFFGFVPIGEGRTGVFIGDVAGHGIEAAVLVGMAKKTFEIWGRSMDDAADVMVQCNADLTGDLDRNTFLTAIYGVLDERDLSFTFARAGHNLPVLVRSGRPPETVEAHGMGIGIGDTETFRKLLKTTRVVLEPGDMLLLYTDGMVEAADASGAEFTVRRLLDAVGDLKETAPVTCLRTVMRALYEFTGSNAQQDDITAICISAKGR